MKNHILKIEICFLFLIITTVFCFGQEIENNQIEFIRVYNSQSILVPPFPKIEIEISNNHMICRNILPSRQTMNREWLDLYDQWDQIPKYQNIVKADYDSVVTFILTSGLLKIDLNYMKPDTTNNLRKMNIGGFSNRYIIETSLGKLELIVSGLYDYNIPETLVNFDRLFKRISHRYKDLK